MEDMHITEKILIYFLTDKQVSFQLQVFDLWSQVLQCPVPGNTQGHQVQCTVHDTSVKNSNYTFIRCLKWTA